MVNLEAGTIAATNIVCKAFNVTSGKVTHRVDSQVALTNCFRPDKPDMSTPGFNLVKKMWAAIKTSNIQWIGWKLKGHQYDKKRQEDLDHWEKANVKASRLAKEYLTRIQSTNPPIHKPTKLEGWNVVLRDKVIIWCFEKKIILYCPKNQTKAYWIWCLSIDDMATEYINWGTFKNTQKYLSTHHHFFIIKHTAGILATGRNVRRWQKRDCGRCPQCGAKDEHGMHIV